MKNILIVCENSNIDAPLRRSVAHLVNSCKINVVANGYKAFAELEAKAFDLIIADSEITGIDSLELAETIEFIDPGLPFIIMLKQAHKMLWGPARALNASPILRPFKPLTFLRLIDTLLHHQLERYRDLSENLSALLESLNTKTKASDVFLVDEAGQILISTGEVETSLLKSLGKLVATKVVTNGLVSERYIQEEKLLAEPTSAQDHELYLTPTTKNLYLGLVSPITIPPLFSHDDIWQHLEQAAQNVRYAFYEYTSGKKDALEQEFPTDVNGNVTEKHMLIPLKLDAGKPTPLAEDEIAINWQIISNSSTVLNRLHDFCEVG